MKRSVLILLFSVLILLTACRTTTPVISDTFEAEVTVSGGDFDCAAHLCRTPDSVTLRLTAPETVAGLTYTVSDGELHTSLDDMSCITSSDSLPPSGAPALLCTVISRLGEAVYEESKDGDDTYRLRLCDGEAVIVCRDGIPRTITASFSPYTLTLTPQSS